MKSNSNCGNVLNVNSKWLRFRKANGARKLVRWIKRQIVGNVVEAKGVINDLRNGSRGGGRIDNGNTGGKDVIYTFTLKQMEKKKGSGSN